MTASARTNGPSTATLVPRTATPTHGQTGVRLRVSDGQWRSALRHAPGDVHGGPGQRLQSSPWTCVFVVTSCFQTQHGVLGNCHAGDKMQSIPIPLSCLTCAHVAWPPRGYYPDGAFVLPALGRGRTTALPFSPRGCSPQRPFVFTSGRTGESAMAYQIPSRSSWTSLLPGQGWTAGQDLFRGNRTTDATPTYRL